MASLSILGGVRPPGLLVLFTVVLLGLGSGAAWYHRARSSPPELPESRLEQWLIFGGPQIHHRLSRFGRFSTDAPWLVTHGIDLEDGGPPRLVGVDCEALPRELARIEGETVVVELPAPRPLGRASLEGEGGRHVPIYGAGETVPDPAGRLRSLARHLLGGLPDALERDVEGASLEIRVGGASRR